MVSKKELDSIYLTAGDGPLDYMYCYYNIQLFKKYLKDKDVLEMSTNLFSSLQLAEHSKRLSVVDGSEEKIADLKSILEKKDTDRYANVSDVICTLFENFVPDRKYDEIVCLRALEHFDDPVGMLKRAGEWLKPGGYINLAVPNGYSLHRRLGVHLGFTQTPDEKTPGDLMKGHRRVYNLRTFTNEVEDAGYKVKLIRGCMVKMFSDEQMKSNNQLFNKKTYEGIFKLSQEIDPSLCSELFIRARLS